MSRVTVDTDDPRGTMASFDGPARRRRTDTVEPDGRDDFDPEDINYCTFRWITTNQSFAIVQATNVALVYTIDAYRPAAGLRVADPAV